VEVQAWLDRYIEAWRSLDPGAIGDLFSEDASYRWNPFDEPTRGREAIVRAWVDEEPDVFDADYRAIAVSDDLAVAQGETTYWNPDRSEATARYSNIFVMRFDEEGRCRDFCEWWMKPRGE
jgi:uncharacterized protein (TIGR02246 family)